MKLRVFTRWWLPVVIWVAVIAVSSTDLMSTDHTWRVIFTILRWLNPDISTQTAFHINTAVRKFAHVFEYAVLAFLVARALRGGMQFRILTTAVTTCLASIILAAADEYHQSFVITRGAAVRDVLLDSCGVLIAVIIFLLRQDRAKSR